MRRSFVAVAIALVAVLSTLVLAVFGAQAAAASPSRNLIKGPPTPEQCLALDGARCLTPASLSTVYGLSVVRAKGLTGKGVAIGIVDSFGSPTIRSDLAVYDKQFGLPAIDLDIVTPAGAPPAFDPQNEDMVGWATETTLDVETAHAVAPDAKIVLIETPTSETEGLQGFPEIIKSEQAMIAANKIDVLSQSFAATEATFASPSQITQLSAEIYPRAQQAGVTVLSSSGDNGPTDLMLDMKTLYDRPVTSWPASDPLVTAVGGTRVDVGANGQRALPDSAWGGVGASGAGGGGLSAVFPQPAFQSTIAATAQGHRAVPDVSLDADPASGLIIYGSFDAGNWSVGGGTSQAAPLFAGIVALADQAAGKRVGYLNNALYALAAAPDHGASSGLVDVTTGSNTLSGLTSVRGYLATAGYDRATGLGTVNASLFVPAIVAATKAQAKPLAGAAAASPPPSTKSTTTAAPTTKATSPPPGATSAADTTHDERASGETIAVAVIVLLAVAGGVGAVFVQRRRATR
jgi:subtilase family serine protease